MNFSQASQWLPTDKIISNASTVSQSSILLLTTTSAGMDINLCTYKSENHQLRWENLGFTVCFR